MELPPETGQVIPSQNQG